MDEHETVCPKCGNKMVYKINSPARVLECVHCPNEVGEVVKPTPLHRAVFDLSAAISNGEETFNPLMRFAEEILNAR